MGPGADEEAGIGAGVVEGTDADTYVGVVVGKVLGISKSWKRSSSLRDKKPIRVSNTHQCDKRGRVKGNGGTHTVGLGYFGVDTGHT